VRKRRRRHSARAPTQQTNSEDEAWAFDLSIAHLSDDEIDAFLEAAKEVAQ
jgi:hypothetical protein